MMLMQICITIISDAYLGTQFYLPHIRTSDARTYVDATWGKTNGVPGSSLDAEHPFYLPEANEVGYWDPRWMLGTHLSAYKS